MMKSAARYVGILLLMALPLSAHSEIKIGYVNYDRVWSHAEPFVQAKTRIEKEFTKRDQTLKQQEEALVAKKREFERDAEKMTETQRRQKAREIMDAERDFQRNIREYQEDFTQRQNEEIAALMDQVAKAIKEIAQKENYDFILQDAAYVNPKLDITEKLLEYLKNLKK